MKVRVMTRQRNQSPIGGVLVSDFDGTMTRNDFYQLVIDKLLPPSVPDYWSKYLAGTMTHFEALQAYFAAIPSDEKDVRDVVGQMELDPKLSEAIQRLNRAGWRVVVASAGCDWYIRQLLNEAGVDVQVYANPGHFEPGKGLLMRMPTDASIASPTLGVDKTRIVRSFLERGLAVAFAGDGLPDSEPARLVPAELRFARGALAVKLTVEGLSYRSFDSWSHIADMLLLQESS